MFRSMAFRADPSAFLSRFDEAANETTRTLRTARSLLHAVEVNRKHRQQIARVAMGLGVEGNRADYFALRAARAQAALNGRTSVEDDDLRVAIELVLRRRVTVPPESNKRAEVDQQPSDFEQSGPKEQNRVAESSDSENRLENTQFPTEATGPAHDFSLPDDAISYASSKEKFSRASGKRQARSASKRGRYIRSSDQQGDARRVAIDATLRAAAPHQSSRRASGREATRRVVHIRKEDLRFKEFERKNGILFIFGSRLQWQYGCKSNRTSEGRSYSTPARSLPVSRSSCADRVPRRSRRGASGTHSKRRARPSSR